MARPASILHESLPGIGHLLNSQTSAIRYMAGTRIFEESEFGDCAYMIENGYVEISSITSGAKEILAILGPGEIFGEMAMLDSHPRSATAMALHETTVIPIPREQLLDEVNHAGPIVKQILIASVNRLRTSQCKDLPEVDENSVVNQPAGQDDSQFELVRVAATRQLRMRFDLERAIANRQFELAYQPIVTLADGRTAGFEALLRWPRLGSPGVTPEEFIPLAEQSRMIVPLGAWVLESALLALTAIGSRSSQKQLNGAGIFVSVNVSPRQLEREEDVEQLATLIEQANIDPACLKLEITEQALLIDPRMATIALARLKATGASIAIDDFGTGYSSLNYLHRFPLDTLKIDRSFVSRIVEDRSRQRIVAAIIGLARELDMEVVAEGVEQTDEASWLRSHACRYAQGYLLAKPAPFATALGYLERDFEF